MTGPPAAPGPLAPGVKSIIAVGSGKGGVGKSTVACNLAVALALDGAKVGLLDADVYGPNQPQMLGAAVRPPEVGPDGKLVPVSAHGVKLMSMGLLAAPGSAMIWRGPMLHSVVRQFLGEVAWGELDYLVVDLPPGTGDVQLSLCQAAAVAGAVVVTTPQGVALSDVRKAVAMFQKLKVPILGIVENMSEFICPSCRAASRVFAGGGAAALAEGLGTPVLASIPLDPTVCETGEAGAPVVVSHPDSAPARALRAAARLAAGAAAELRQ